MLTPSGGSSTMSVETSCSPTTAGRSRAILPREGVGAGGKVGPFHGGHRGEQRRDVVVGVGGGERGDDRVDVGADVEVLGHHGEASRAVTVAELLVDGGAIGGDRRRGHGVVGTGLPEDDEQEREVLQRRLHGVLLGGAGSAHRNRRDGAGLNDRLSPWGIVNSG